MLAEEHGGRARIRLFGRIIEEIGRTNAYGIGFPLHSDIVVPYVEALARPRRSASGCRARRRAR